MSRSAKGDIENPGTQVSAKSALNRAILDHGWGEWGRQLEYKQSWRSGVVIFVNLRYASQTCPKCGHIDRANRISQAEFKCQSCYHETNADEVGAINVIRDRTCPVRLKRYCGDFALYPKNPQAN